MRISKAISSTDAARMRKLAATLLLIGGAAAAGLALVAMPRQRAPAAPPAPASAHVAADRIALTPADLREAYAAGLIDRPIKTILDVRGPMTYGDYRWNE